MNTPTDLAQLHGTSCPHTDCGSGILMWRYPGSDDRDKHGLICTNCYKVYLKVEDVTNDFLDSREGPEKPVHEVGLLGKKLQEALGGKVS